MMTRQNQAIQGLRQRAAQMGQGHLFDDLQTPIESEFLAECKRRASNGDQQAMSFLAVIGKTRDPMNKALLLECLRRRLQAK